MSADIVTVSMTRFADFCVSDSVGQLSKVRETRRQYEQPYTPSNDFWSRWREGIEAVHRRGSGRDELRRIAEEAKDNRGEQYASASDGYRTFWGRKRIEFLGVPTPVLWGHDRLRVKVNPEWLLQINETPTVVKLHLKERLPLTQRLANPLLHLLGCYFGADGPAIALIDVHRGKLWAPTAASRSMESVLRMQAAAFLAGWDAVDLPGNAA